MAIPPPRGPSFDARTLVPFGPHPKHASRSSLEDTPEQKTMAQERDARDRAMAAEEQAAAAERDAEVQLSHIKEDGEQQAEAENTRNERMVESIKNKGYGEIRELQRKQQEQLRKTRQKGDRELTNLKNYYRDTTYKARRAGSQDLEDISRQNFLQSEYQKKSAAATLDTLRSQHEQQMQQLMDSQNHTFNEIAGAEHKEQERLKSESQQALERSNQHFQDQYKTEAGQERQTLENLEARASRAIKEIRADTALKLGAYASRQRDPFYKLVDIDARLHESSDGYTLTATIPPQEQKHVSVSIKGGNLVVSGYRRNHEKLDLGEGHKTETSAYQSFSESYPLTWPVDDHRLSREFDGDTLRVFVPKKTSYEPPRPFQAKVERAKLEMPDFPDNLPIVRDVPHTPDPDSPEPAPEPGQTPGSRPLG